MTKRDLHKCLCDCCGSSYSVFYCGVMGDYICGECLEKEQAENQPKTHLDYLEKIGEV
jgi:hypothetical protein